jgi:hypothetical protein
MSRGNRIRRRPWSAPALSHEQDNADDGEDVPPIAAGGDSDPLPRLAD